MLAATSESGWLSGRLERPWGVAEAGPPVPRRPRLLDVVREALRVRHYSRRTERAYVGWIRRYVLVHGKRHPAEMGAQEVSRFLSWLAVEGRVTASTQNQALAALLFLYGPVLGVELPWLDERARAACPPRLPVVLSRRRGARRPARDARDSAPDGRAALRRRTSAARVRAAAHQGRGLRRPTRSWSGAGRADSDRVTMLPGAGPVRAASVISSGCGRSTPATWRLGPAGSSCRDALARKYPNAGREWPWQWVFPATRTYVEPATGQRRRHHLHETVVQRAVHRAVREAGLTKARHVPHVPPLVRDAPAGGRLRHPDGPGAAGAPGRADDHDLHARAQPGPAAVGRRPTGWGRRARWRASPLPERRPRVTPRGHAV